MPLLSDPKHEAFAGLAIISHMVDQGWRFQWEPETMFIVAKHPRGGLRSVLEIRADDFHPIGPVVAELLNQSMPKGE